VFFLNNGKEIFSPVNLGQLEGGQLSEHDHQILKVHDGELQGNIFPMLF
jgi:hypothetical protein